MAAVAVVEGLLEGLQLVQVFSNAAASASAAIQTAQACGKPVDFTSILGAIDTDEAAVLAAIAAAKAKGT